jgi:hypothetical protein
MTSCQNRNYRGRHNYVQYIVAASIRIDLEYVYERYMNGHASLERRRIAYYV